MDRSQQALPRTGRSAESPWYRTNHHWVSPTNFDPALQDSYAFPSPLTIFDSTVRKILLTPGLRPATGDLMRVAEAVAEAGVGEIFINVPWWDSPTPGRLEAEACRAILSGGFGFHTTVWTDSLIPSNSHRAVRQAVPAEQVLDALMEMGADTVEPWLGDPGDAAGRDRQLEDLEVLFSLGRSLGVSIAVSMPDVGRADFEYLVQVANEAASLGAVRVDLQDSYSSLSPEAMRLFITRFRSRIASGMSVTMHVHNDFGLASAAAIAAASAGAHPDVAVNGISYRAGFAALEEVAVALEMLYGVPTGIRLDRLRQLSQVVDERSGLARHPLKAITGAHAFVRDLPTWQLPVLENGPEGFPPSGSCIFPPVVGARMQVVWGNHLSDEVIRAKLRRMGLEFTEGEAQEIGRRIEERVRALTDYPRWLTEDQVEAICRDVAG